MPDNSEHERMVEETWSRFMNSGRETKEFRRRHLFGLIPSDPRCRFCNAPFKGVGGTLMRLVYDNDIVVVQEEREEAKIIDIMEALKASLKDSGSGKKKPKAAAKKSAAKKTPAKKTRAKKKASK